MIRELLENDSLQAEDAVDLLVYHAGRELGSLAAALGGLDALVFTAGIGQHSAVVRERICREASWLGHRLMKKLMWWVVLESTQQTVQCPPG